MKSIHHDFLTKEAEEKIGNIGSRQGERITYTRADYLTPGKVAQRFGITLERAKDLMKSLVFKRATFGVNGHKSQIVVRLGKGTGTALYLHPLAIEAFQKYIGERKD